MSFKNIIGQEVPIRALKNLIAEDQVRGAYLFLGPDGVGKRTTSMEFAKAVNCDGKKGDACDLCSSCNKIDSMNHPDVFIISSEGSSNSIKIKQIRRIIYQASLKPYEGRKIVFIISNGEEMTIEAQNALLKLLEEPPENHILIVTASNIEGLLSTVISRCKVVRFSCLGQDQIQAFLQRRGIDEKKAILFSHMAMGSPGRALGYERMDIITTRDRIVNDFFFRKTALLREGTLNEEIKRDLKTSLYMLLCWYRDLMVFKFTQDKTVLLNVDRSEEISPYSSRFSIDRLERDIATIMKTMVYMKSNMNPKIALFNMAIELKGI